MGCAHTLGGHSHGRGTVMNQTMKAAVVHAFGEPLRIEEVKVPLPGHGQILVKIEASGGMPYRPPRG
jgi:hypothetical protein